LAFFLRVFTATKKKKWLGKRKKKVADHIPLTDKSPFGKGARFTKKEKRGKGEKKKCNIPHHSRDHFVLTGKEGGEKMTYSRGGERGEGGVTTGTLLFPSEENPLPYFIERKKRRGSDRNVIQEREGREKKGRKPKNCEIACFYRKKGKVEVPAISERGGGGGTLLGKKTVGEGGLTSPRVWGRQSPFGKKESIKERWVTRGENFDLLSTNCPKGKRKKGRGCILKKKGGGKKKER